MIDRIVKIDVLTGTHGQQIYNFLFNVYFEESVRLSAANTWFSAATVLLCVSVWVCFADASCLFSCLLILVLK